MTSGQKHRLGNFKRCHRSLKCPAVSGYKLRRGGRSRYGIKVMWLGTAVPFTRNSWDSILWACSNTTEKPCSGRPPVTGRMNWDRVRMENLAHLHGSEWVSPFANASRAHNKKRKNKKKGARRKKLVPLATQMVGCTCGKAIRF